MLQLFRVLAAAAVITAGFLTVFSTPALAYYSTMDTGEILKKGEYRGLLESNLVFNDMSGLNLVGKFDLGFNESSNFRAVLGGGAVGFQTGVLYKWIPIPDFDNQPAMGLLGGFIYARNNGENYLNLRVHPLVSKKFETDQGLFTPYGALPFGVTIAKGYTRLPLQLSIGTEWQPVGMTRTSFMAELALNVNESYNYIGVAALVKFDEEKGFKVE